ncbi:MAG: P-II family nitrogen regulator [Firmicutes bacterium]|uniref:P-II family nitrogen regulator n=1 Tax=Candidatus Colimorpha enterica TaxID=3083063 RepID=A0AAE3FH44_9BACT|nr:P-II family nitrogen regulator [Candidatus Colimorpha enterica]MDY2906537.1 P-II family nitrogen regulator [Eubacteriales bacterium]
MNFIISITSPEALPVLTGVCEDMALPLNVTLSGRGTAVKSMLDVLGIESNLKRIMFSVANEEKTREFITRQKRQLHIGVPGHGIVIAVPVKSIGGGKTVAYLRGEDGTAKYTPSLNYAYELIVVIANEGRTDTVMNAARAAGARGGTVLHGKGTGSEAAMKFLNISIADEKEVILIVAPTAEKTAIMSEILKKAGPDTDAKAIAFSLPTSAVAGFGFSGDAE